MTANERIEKLLNRFGQTISDLPKANSEFESAYAYHSHESIRNEAIKFGKASPKPDYMEDYACHLTDIIDRMETALETASSCLTCSKCEYLERPGCGHHIVCDGEKRISDTQLTGMTGFEFDNFIENAKQEEDMLLVGGARGAGMKYAIEKAMKENSNEQS